jgi:hypothetical protein
MDEATQSGVENQSQATQEVSQDSDFASIISGMNNGGESEQEGGQEAVQGAEGTEGQADQGQPESEEEPTFTLVIDGQEVTKKQSEIIADAQRVAAANKRFEEAAAARKEVDAQKQQAAQDRAQLQQALAHYQQQLESLAPQPPNMELLNTDPVEYLHRKAQYDQLMSERQQAQAAQAYLQQQSQAEQQAQMQQYMADQKSRLLEAIPEWKDEAKAKAGVEEVKNYLSKKGFTEQEIGSLADHRLIVLARQAAMFESLVSKQAQTVNKVQKLPPKVEKTGSGVPVTDGRTAGMQRLKQSGSARDAAALIAQIL